MARHAQAEDAVVLRSAQQTEMVSYIKTSLDIAIARLSSLAQPVTADPNDEVDVPAEVRRQIRTQAVEYVAGLLIHEIASPIGLAKRSASKEIANYEQSRTKRHLESVDLIFNAIAQLKSAAAVPKPEQFDLAELLRDIVSAEVDDEMATVSLAGATPMMITSDPALVTLAIRNGVRNAVEAMSSIDVVEPHPIIVTWGQTDVTYWVAILDHGIGVVGPPEAAFKIGISTKTGHSGFGLAIARQAIETLGGTVSLESEARGGARYWASWER